MKLLNKFVEKELELAHGCTEPGAVAYAVAAAASHLEGELRKITVKMDGFVYKNGMTTGIPGVKGARGNKVAAALGVLTSDFLNKKLQILSNLNDDTIKKAKKLLNFVNLEVVDSESLYIHAIIEGDNTVESLIVNDHSNLNWVKVNGKMVFENDKMKRAEANFNLADEFRDYSISDMIELLENEFTEKHLDYLKKGLDYNLRLVEASKAGEARGIGKHYDKLSIENDTQQIAALIAHGVDARMSGVARPALASSGSGNQGITISLGIYFTGRYLEKEEIKIYKATMLGHLIAYYTKIYMGKLSSFCGLLFAAAPAILAGLLYLDDKNDKIEEGINNILSDSAGIFCDGAKSSCAFKAITAYDQAYRHYQFIKSGLNTQLPTGFVSDKLSKTLVNLRKLSMSEGDTINGTLFKIIENIFKDEV